MSKSCLVLSAARFFFGNSSCITQLLTASLTDTIAQSMDKIIQTNVVYLDFVKALDGFRRSFSYTSKAMGVLATCRPGLPITYLSGRSQRVVLGWCCLTVDPSFLGSSTGEPTRYHSLHDLPGVLSEGTQTALYADDTKLFSPISSIAHCERLSKL